MWGVLAREFLCIRAPFLMNTQGAAVPHLCFYRAPEGTEREEQATAEKAVTKEEFQGEGTAPAPGFTAAQPGVAGGSGMRAASLLKTGAAPPAWASKWVGTTSDGLKLLFRKGKQNGNKADGQ